MADPAAAKIKLLQEQNLEQSNTIKNLRDANYILCQKNLYLMEIVKHILGKSHWSYILFVLMFDDNANDLKMLTAVGSLQKLTCELIKSVEAALDYDVSLHKKTQAALSASRTRLLEQCTIIQAELSIIKKPILVTDAVRSLWEQNAAVTEQFINLCSASGFNINIFASSLIAMRTLSKLQRTVFSRFAIDLDHLETCYNLNGHWNLNTLEIPYANAVNQIESYLTKSFENQIVKILNANFVFDPSLFNATYQDNIINDVKYIESKAKIFSEFAGIKCQTVKQLSPKDEYIFNLLRAEILATPQAKNKVILDSVAHNYDEFVLSLSVALSSVEPATAIDHLLFSTQSENCILKALLKALVFRYTHKNLSIYNMFDIIGNWIHYLETRRRTCCPKLRKKNKKKRKHNKKTTS